MRKYKREEIEEAYQEFLSDREWVHADAHDRVAYDFLTQTQYLDDYLKTRHFPIQYLYYCLAMISSSTDPEERKRDFENYCKANKILFTKRREVDFVFQAKERNFLPLEPPEDYTLGDFYDNSSYSLEGVEELITSLAQKIMSAKRAKIPFTLLDYYAYYSLDIRTLRDYLDSREEFKLEYEIVRSYIEKLDLGSALETIDPSEVLKPGRTPRVIHNLYIQEESLRETVECLVVTGYPVLTGTLNIALPLQKEGNLEDIEKQKVRKRFEKRLRKR